MASKLAKTLAPALAVMCLAATPLAFAQDHEHSHGAKSPATLTLNHGKKWNGDESLRLAMVKIRDAVEKELPAIRAGKASPAQFEALARKVNEQVSFMVQNCRLDKETDAALHLVLADIIAGAEAMEGKSASTSRRNGALRISQALENYASYFNHPGWSEHRQ